MKYLLSLFVILAACRPATLPKAPTPDEEPQCTALTSCDLDGTNGTGTIETLIDALVENGLPEALKPYLPKGETGARGEAGAKGDTGAAGPQGPQGFVGAPGATGAQGLQGDVGPQGDEGLPGLPGPQGIAGSQGPAGAKGDTGNTGPAGPTGTPGSNGSVGAQGGVGNTSLLSATRTFNPTTDYAGSITVNSQAVFVPPIISVYFGNQGTGFAYVYFDTTKCTYQGNNKSGSALALFEFVDCRDAAEAVVATTPGTPFAFAGTVTLVIGAGTGTSKPVQAVAFLQIQ